MFAPTCGALDEYLSGLKKLEERFKALDGVRLLVGHAYQERTPLRGAAGKQLITDMRIAAEKVLSGELEGKPARTERDGTATELRQLNVGLAGLWYNPKNLVTDQAALEFLKVQTAAGKNVIPRPVFSSFQTEYSAVVGSDAGRLEVTPTAYWPNHKGITVNGKPVKSGATIPVDTASGLNKVEIAVTSEKGTVRTYTVAVTKGDH
jgi:hypothetical protein